MSINRPRRAQMVRESKRAIAQALEEHRQDARDDEAEFFAIIYGEWLDREFFRRGILGGFDENYDQFPTEAEHRAAILSLGPLWPSEQVEFADTLTRLDLA